MIDINELRAAVEAAGLNAISRDEVLELLDRIEAAEQERDWHAERCEDAMNECDALRTKIEAMERQEPIAWMNSRNGFICKENKNPDYNVPLVPLPGAKGE